jgi:hypothetical protein
VDESQGWEAIGDELAEVGKALRVTLDHPPEGFAYVTDDEYKTFFETCAILLTQYNPVVEFTGSVPTASTNVVCTWAQRGVYDFLASGAANLSS